MSVKHAARMMGSSVSLRVTIVVVLALLLIVVLAPIYIVGVNSFKTTTDYYNTGPFGLPDSPTLQVMRSMWRISSFGLRIGNSMVISGTTTLLVIFLSLFNAYALGIGRPKRLKSLLILIMFVMTLPAGALVYPRFYAFRQLGLYNTRIAVIAVLTVTHMAFGSYFLTNVFLKFPKEFIEASEIDGMTRMNALLRVVLPLNMASVSVLFVFVFIWTWNEFYAPLILLSSASKMTVPLAILLARVPMAEPQVTNLAAISFLAMLPCVLFFVLFRSYLKRGITFAGVKG